jgi:hypothetical protein
VDKPSESVAANDFQIRHHRIQAMRCVLGCGGTIGYDNMTITRSTASPLLQRTEPGTVNPIQQKCWKDVAEGSNIK